MVGAHDAEDVSQEARRRARGLVRTGMCGQEVSLLELVLRRVVLRSVAERHRQLDAAGSGEGRPADLFRVGDDFTKRGKALCMLAHPSKGRSASELSAE